MSRSKPSLVTLGPLTVCLLIGVGSYLSYRKYQAKQRKDRVRSEWISKSVLRISDIFKSQFFDLFEVAMEMEQMVFQHGGCKLADGKVLANVFYEPSTRTNSSFQAAMLRLGGSVINISNISSSSVKKGESLQDTMQCLSQYSDVLVLRHPQKGAADRVHSKVSVPVLNAGDGAGEHPTQALLDLFTIYKAHNRRIDGLTITFVGDLKYGRTVHSLIPALSLFDNMKFYFVAPKSLRVPSKYKEKNINFVESDSLSVDMLKETDVLYVTRIQKERLSNYDSKQTDFVCINNETLKHCKKDMIIMHPLPRINEISVEVDDDPRAIYMNEQMKNGMYMRMALLSLVLGVY